ncbi:hypothetical protein C8Q80DRAFT_1179955 [Daedaleopsis nitida]|nr:hypothetical protein C8Q80DRAFT_1179955 [Daedaleopsis nitida]
MPTTAIVIGSCALESCPYTSRRSARTFCALINFSRQLPNNFNIFRCIVSVENSAPTLSSSGPVMIPATSGWYHSSLPLAVCTLSNTDISLGSDWLQACCPPIPAGVLQSPVHNAPTMPTGHTYYPRVPGTSKLFICKHCLQVTLVALCRC